MDAGWVSRQLGHHSVAFTLDTYLHLLPGRRDFAAVEFGDSSHHPDTRTQNRAKRDPEILH